MYWENTVLDGVGRLGIGRWMAPYWMSTVMSKWGMEAKYWEITGMYWEIYGYLLGEYSNVYKCGMGRYALGDGWLCIGKYSKCTIVGWEATVSIVRWMAMYWRLMSKLGR
jgi:hypothetical protein